MLENRYHVLFHLVDLTKNFYFSYTYDLTRTMQQHMTSLPRDKGACAHAMRGCLFKGTWRHLTTRV